MIRLKVTDSETVEPSRIFISSIGVEETGTGSGYAWIDELTGNRLIARIAGVSTDQMEYLSLLSALEHLPPGSRAQILSDSALVGEFNGRSSPGPEFEESIESARQLIKDRDLKVDVFYTTVQRNAAKSLIVDYFQDLTSARSSRAVKHAAHYE
jgi:ribonuclease HI